MTQSFDDVVIGGGSAGCIVAAELAADPRRRVLLLECGDAATSHPETLRVDGYKDAFINDRLIWERFSVPQRACSDKSLFMGSGRGLGGSGSVNAMVYLRGSRADFEMWETKGWTWDEVREDFEALERVLDVRRRTPTAFTETCIQAAEEAGFRRKEDLNDGDLLGVLGYEAMNYREHERRSSYVSFLAPRLHQPNLTVETNATVDRLVFDADRRLRAVEARVRDAFVRFEVRRNAVLCAGALETPKVLMLSGIGPGPELRRHGIAPVVEQPAIGENLQDHPNVTLFFRGRRPVDCNYPQLYGFHRANPATRVPVDASDTCYVFYPARSSLREALIRLLPLVALPPAIHRQRGVSETIRQGVRLAFRSQALRRFVENVYGIVVILGKPKSRGTVRLASGRPEDPVEIDPAYLADPEDLETMCLGVDRARRLARSAPLRAWGSLELHPGPMGRTRAGVEAFIRNNVMTTYHFAGTCRMGDHESDPLDARLRLRGVTGVRVADASTIPCVPVSALNAPSMLVGYRGSRFVREDDSIS